MFRDLRFRLLSLIDMKSFDTASVAAALAVAAECAGRATLVGVTDSTSREVLRQVEERCKRQGVKVQINIDGHLGSGIAKLVHPQLIDALEQIERILRDSPLHRRFAERAADIRKSLQESPEDKFNADVINARVTDLTRDLLADLSEPRFLYIPPEKRALFDQAEPPFGALVADKFDSSARDVAAAARCAALDEWTACVGHLMRALENPLQVFADRLGVKFPAPTDLENWKNIVDQMVSKINSEVKRLEGTPKSHERNAELQLLGEIALDFRHFKNAWRNNVAHGREWYDEQTGSRTYEAVKHFMQKMAAACV